MLAVFSKPCNLSKDLTIEVNFCGSPSIFNLTCTFLVPSTFCKLLCNMEELVKAFVVSKLNCADVLYVVGILFK